MMRYRSLSADKLTPIWVIMIINLLVFIGALVYGKRLFVFELNAASFLEQPWTIITNMFTHYSLWHILANMLTLYFYGSFLCQLIGARKFLIIYFCGGILGNIFFLVLAPNSSAIGASGAIFALGGALAVLTPKLRVYTFPIPIPMPLWVAVIGGFIVLTLFPQIAWQAHLGGLVFGLASGFYFRKKQRVFF